MPSNGERHNTATAHLSEKLGMADFRCSIPVRDGRGCRHRIPTVVSPIQCHILESRHEGPLQFSFHALKDFVRLFSGHGWLVLSALY